MASPEEKISNEGATKAKRGLGSFVRDNRDALMILGMGLTSASRPGGSFNEGVSRGMAASQGFAARDAQQKRAVARQRFMQKLRESGRYTEEQLDAFEMAPDAAGTAIVKSAFGGEDGQRRILKGADGFQYYADTKERVLPEVEATQKPETYTDINSVRKEFAKESSDFAETAQQIDTIYGAAKLGTAAGDLSTIFAYMKMLDPGSTVREGEYANAQNAGSIGTAVRNIYNQVIDGTRLTPEQRDQFLESADSIYDQRLSAHTRRKSFYGEIARRRGYNEADVIQPYGRTSKSGGVGGDPVVDRYLKPGGN